ncbi:MAG: hypothetical protein H6653_07905 [Ardenticatenaceae bacterium]|nr:hypothetical protein [Ardenticatenaceae bacterium]
MPNFFKRAWNDIFVERKNIESYIVLAAIVIVIFADIVGVDTAEILIEIVLAVLGVFIYIGIEQSHAIEQLKTTTQATQSNLQSISDEIKELPQVLTIESNSLKFLLPHDLPNYRIEASDADTIDVFTWSGYSFFTQFDSYFYNRLENECKLRWMILDPECEATQVIYTHSRTKTIRSGINQMLQHYTLSRSRFAKKVDFQLRTTSWFPPFNMVIVDREKAHGFMVIGLYPAYLRTTQNERRHFVIYKRNQPDDFNTYVNQFELLWENKEFTKPYNLPKE